MSPAGASRKTPLFEQLKNEYDQAEQIVTLETRKKKLEELRSFNKPVRRADIAEHAI